MTQSNNLTMAVRDAHRFDEAALAAFMKDNVKGFGGKLTIRQFAGGQSNPTYWLEADGHEYVLRKKPPGKLLPSAHQVDREYRIMTALADTAVPVPKTYALCRDDSVIGTDFFIMEYVEGRIFSEVLLPELSRAERSQYYDHFIQVLAALHAIDVESHGLADYGRPGNFFQRQIGRWTKQYEASKTDQIDAMEKLMAWLPEHIPDDHSVSIYHGDYRPGNSVAHSTEPRIIAVLDWELSTLGHPLADLAYCCIGHHGDVGSGGAGVFGQDLDALGLPNEQQIVARYCELTGRDDIEDWNFYIIFALFRLAAIAQGVYKRGLDGIAAQAEALNFGEHCRRRAEVAWRLVKES